MKSLPKRIAVVGVAVVVIIVMIAFIFFRQKPIPNNGQGVAGNHELTADELREIVELRNVGIALLENHQWEAGSQKFQSLAQILPESQLAFQNLAIGQTSHYVNLDPSSASDVIENAKQAALMSIAKLREIAPDDSVSFRLEAQIEEKQANAEAAVAILETAAEKTPEDPTLWYEISRVSQTSRDPATLAAGKAALDRLHELVPNNVFAFMQWMNATLREETSQLPEIIDELEALIKPLAPGIEKRNRYNVMTFLDSARENLNKGNLQAAKNGLAPIKNIITGDDVSRSDRDRLDMNLLAFVDFQFGVEIQKQLDSLEPVTSTDAGSVSFEVSPSFPKLEGVSQQAELADLNLDGRVELLVLQQNTLKVFSYETKSSQWVSSFQVQIEDQPESFVLVDLDYDLKEQSNLKDQSSDAKQEFKAQHTADLDLILFGKSGIQIYQNNLSELGGNIAFEKVESKTELTSLKNVTEIVPADLNNDGDLDLAVIADGRLTYWNNQGNFEFELEPLSPKMEELDVVDCVALDFDRDIDIDLLVLLKDGNLGLLDSYRHGTFRWQTLQRKYSGKTANSLTVLDADHNGSWDVAVSGSDGVEVFFTQMPKTGQVLFITTEKVSSLPTQHSLNLDYDNDGYRDLASRSETGLNFLRGIKSGERFSNDDILKQKIGDVGSVSSGDFDADGDLDLAVVADGDVVLLTNQGGNQNAWIDVALLAARVEDKGGSGSQRINHYGYGSLIEIRSGADFQQLYVDSPISKFGLGQHQQADAVRVIWTNGIPQNIVQPQANQIVWEVQKLLGSCPYLYTWDGEKYVFLTDLLWAAPIGLQDATAQLVPARPWEYLKVSGDLLKPQDGRYRLQITEELWEVAYFDQVELIAVDHPAEIDIYTNEKVGPPSIAEHEIHLVNDKRIPVSVKNHKGRDLLSEVEAEDNVYAKPFTERLTQGYTDDSYMEIDFGLNEKPAQLTLFLTGWVRPTDTGINVALSEDAQRPGPAAPSIQVPNEAGEFVEVIPYCGFPGGKTKTIVIDLSDHFLTDDYRIRLATSMELYWDQIFFSTETIAEQPVTQSLTCLSAELHYRGVSRIEYGRDNGPEQFLYQNAITTSAWPSIDGNFTRFGDVLELVTKVDDQLLVMGTGDEMTIEFSLPEKPLPKGWKRDFILHCVGWDKDANLHTVTGQTVEPLPFVKMKSYPYFDQTDAPHPPEYLRKYQTRKLDSESFRKVLQRSTLTELELTEPTQPE